jgi:multiple sugar transport system permease protein
MASLIVVNVWKEFPFAMIMMLAGLQTVPDQLLRAAKVDGASAWNRFWHVTVPHVRHVAGGDDPVAPCREPERLHDPYVMTGGGPAGASEIWITHIYQIAFGRIRFGSRLCLFCDPLHHHDGARLLLRPGAHPRR